MPLVPLHSKCHQVAAGSVPTKRGVFPKLTKTTQDVRVAFFLYGTHFVSQSALLALLLSFLGKQSKFCILFKSGRVRRCAQAKTHARSVVFYPGIQSNESWKKRTSLLDLISDGFGNMFPQNKAVARTLFTRRSEKHFLFLWKTDVNKCRNADQSKMEESRETMHLNDKRSRLR